MVHSSWFIVHANTKPEIPNPKFLITNSKFLSYLSTIQLINLSTHYSVRKDSTGFATAALIAWKLTVTSVITIATKAAHTNTTGLILI